MTPLATAQATPAGLKGRWVNSGRFSWVETSRAPSSCAAYTFKDPMRSVTAHR